VIIEIKKAAASTTATKNELHEKSYLKTALLSRASVQIGCLLLCLNENDKSNWQRFETMLRNYIDLKLNEVKL